MAPKTITADSVGEAYLTLLADRGIDYLFANAGTDFPPIVEALAKAARTGAAVPRAMVVPHENVAVAMAHGVTMVTGKPQAVMTHVNVGTANSINGIINAARARIPMLMTAGRTPLTEGPDLPGSRNRNIHWAQEMYDQAGMLRELVKWDYELRNAVQLENVVDRALEISMAEPQGPVYLSLPREVLTEPVGDFTYHSPPRRRPPAPAHPDPAAIEELADLLAGAAHPVIITGYAGRRAEGFEALSSLADKFAIGVVEFRHAYAALPTDHAMHLGFEPAPVILEADVIVVLECDVPWVPATDSVPESAKVIHVGSDPLFAAYPMRSFPRDLTIPADAHLVLPLLSEALDSRADSHAATIDARRAAFTDRHNQQRADWAAALDGVSGTAPLHPLYVSHCINKIVTPETILVNEYPMAMSQFHYDRPGSYYSISPAGGLGWGFGAALGAKLAAPDKMVIVTLGDGTYIFNNPTAAHFVSRAQNLPVLVVIFNNGRWNAVARATQSDYPDGEAVKANQMPLTSLEPSPDFELIARSCGAFAEKVTEPDDLLPALEKAVHAVTVEKRQALLNVICRTP